MPRLRSRRRRVSFGLILLAIPTVGTGAGLARSPAEPTAQGSNCAPRAENPFLSVEEIKRDAACVAAAIGQRLESAAKTPPILSILAERDRLATHYVTDGAVRPSRECLVLNAIVLPNGLTATIQLTAGDAIFELSIAELGVKADALPGRIETIAVTPARTGRFEGRLIPDRTTRDASARAIDVLVLAPGDYAKWKARTLWAKGCGSR
jgi:heme/copper-type cytochrome/quinol oxidase subunit 2